MIELFSSSESESDVKFLSCLRYFGYTIKILLPDLLATDIIVIIN